MSSREIPHAINQVRIGEAILLGKETLFQEPVSGTFQDAFVLESEVMEVREKPLFAWEKGHVEKESSRVRKQAVVALGRQDIGSGRLFPCMPGISVLGVTSDHLVVKVDKGVHQLRAGDVLSFVPEYQALAAAMISPFVNKEYLTEGEGAHFETANISRCTIQDSGRTIQDGLNPD